MTLPEDALARARSAAAEMRAAGAYADATPTPPGPPPVDASYAKLPQWALIEPDLAQIRSFRRTGAPLTALKRLLVRLLAQYHVQLIGKQTRFNVTLLDYVTRLEARVSELEARLRESEPGPPG